MSLQLQKVVYINNRKPGVASFMDGSKLRIGKNFLYNRLSSVHNIAIQWTNGINPDKLLIELKKTFISIDYN